MRRPHRRTRPTRLSFTVSTGSIFGLYFYVLLSILLPSTNSAMFIHLTAFFGPLTLFGGWVFSTMMWHVAEPYLQKQIRMEQTTTGNGEGVGSRVSVGESTSQQSNSSHDKITLVLNGLSWYDRALGVLDVLIGTPSRKLRTVSISIIAVLLLVMGVTPIRMAVLSSSAGEFFLLIIYFLAGAISWWLLVVAGYATLTRQSRLKIHFSHEGIEWMENDQVGGKIGWADVGYIRETDRHLHIIGRRVILFYPIPKRLVVQLGQLAALRTLLIKYASGECKLKLFHEDA